MTPFLSYDSKNMWGAAVPETGITKSEWKELAPKLKAAHRSVTALRIGNTQGFFDLPFDEKQCSYISKEAKKVVSRFAHVVVIGIGGSDLGARTLWQALGNKEQGPTLHFLSNPDPEELAPWMNKGADWKNIALVVVSKSGSTLETMAIFTALRKSLIESVGEKNHADHVWVITDPTDGILYAIAQEHGYAIIPHPLNVGGRFAVLSSVGLFPAACGGVNIKKLLSGARAVELDHRRLGVKHDAAIFAGLHYLAYEKRGQKIHVLMPYASALQQLGFWYRQIWAESLGKRKNGGRVGPTPVAALGSVDQHSQIQLYTDGPNDKVVTFIKVNRFRQKITVPKTWMNTPELSYMCGQSFQSIMDAELSGTAHALTKSKTPNGTLIIPSITPESLGALFQFYELATAYMGELFGINAFDQPGVEEGKKHAKALLAKNG